MFQKVIIGVILCLSAGLVKGQIGVWLHDDDVYIYSLTSESYDAAISRCQTYDAFPTSLNNEVVRNKSRDIRSGQTTDEVWNMNNRSVVSGQCDVLNLKTGLMTKLSCTETRPVVCVGAAWRNLTNSSGDSFGFSNVKLANRHAQEICEQKVIDMKLRGSLVMITSNQTQQFLTKFTQTSKVGYWINLNHEDSSKTGGYNNWVVNKTAITQDLCTQMNPDGKWDNIRCYDLIRFICQWKKNVTTTTAASTTQHSREMDTTKKATSVMPKTTVSSKISSTKAMKHTTVAATTTSASVIIEGSIIVTILTVVVNIIFI